MFFVLKATTGRSVFQGQKAIPLPIAAAFQAEYLDSIPWKKLTQACLNAPFETFRPNMPLISPSSGMPSKLCG